MSADPHGRGGPAPVSRIEDLPPLERRLVEAARLWRDGPDGRAALARGFEARHGAAVGRAAGERLDALMRLALARSRRPLRLMPVGELGVAGDECVLARLVALAAEGAREDAILMCALVVRADLALDLARIAMALGHLMQRRPGALAVLAPA